MPIVPGAEPLHIDGGPVGVLFVHGFTGSPASLKPWAQRLADDGYTVSVPLLPGHGTTWQECNTTTWSDWYAAVETAFDALRETCETVFVCGLSMGGGLSLRLAQQRGEQVAGLVLVNPALASGNKQLLALPLLRRFLPALPGLSNDICLEGQNEVAYAKNPLKALASFVDQWPTLQKDLPLVHQPVLVFRSLQDHVVDDTSGKLIFNGVSSADAEEVLLHDSYHVATLDHDAESIIAGTLEFVRRLVPATSA